MKHFDADGWRLAYDDVGEGEPIVLLHGFAADRRLNWKLPGWYDLLADAGYRVLALDARGHGQSARPSDVEAYRPAGIAGDAIRLLDHLGLRKACLFGYSMGGRNAAWLLAHHGRRFRAVVIGGTGLNLLAPAEARRWAKRGFALTRDRLVAGRSAASRSRATTRTPSRWPSRRWCRCTGARCSAADAPARSPRA